MSGLLIYACCIGDLNYVKHLLESKIDVSVSNGYDYPITSTYYYVLYKDIVGHSLCFDNHYEIVKLLLENNANINAKDKYNNTLLINTSQVKNDSSIKNGIYLEDYILISKNTIGSAHNKIVKLAIESKADVNHAGVFGDTALINASVAGNDEIVKMLLQAKADINHKNYYGNDAMYFASWKQHTETFKLLKQKKIQQELEKCVVDSKTGIMQHVFPFPTISGGHSSIFELISEYAVDATMKRKWLFWKVLY